MTDDTGDVIMSNVEALRVFTPKTPAPLVAQNAGEEEKRVKLLAWGYEENIDGKLYYSSDIREAYLAGHAAAAAGLRERLQEALGFILMMDTGDTLKIAELRNLALATLTAMLGDIKNG